MDTSSSSASRKVYRRCPSCKSRVAQHETACPICGHLFAEPAAAQTDAADPSSLGRSAGVPVDRDKTESVFAPSRVIPLRRRRSGLSQLPWGVIGVLAVISALVIGAVLLLQGDGQEQVSNGEDLVATSQPAAGAASAPSLTQQVAIVPTVVFAETLTPYPTATDTPVPASPTPVPPVDTPTPLPDIEYEVQAGDTCGGIAMKYNLSVELLIAYNNLDSGCFLRIGDKLRIPQPTPTPGPAGEAAPQVVLPTETPRALMQSTQQPAQPTATLPPQIVYTVREGDTCSEIAERFRTTVGQLIQQNGLDNNCLIRIGQVLTLTFATPTPAVSPTPIIAQTPTPRVGYSAPALISPLEDALITEAVETVTLTWLSVGLLKENEWYVVQ
ncbi:MAG: LysM peptidoglycan-binding domain-containing protein, partial [Anaerolineae bacterium]|nr:LysM peptidoglycan-binding domain-containing protein [Thermoflexales bacterium]MDW8408149.1 LysM peptidoglycan-binding domain-containing protein [Anaerolineae bacterium]